MGETLKPTDYAKVHLQSAKHFATRVLSAKTDQEYRAAVGASVDVFAFALEEMATAMRATYILLEQINQKLDKLGRP
jgi:hypothetical protein